jgi:hypothetical protein
MASHPSTLCRVQAYVVSIAINSRVLVFAKVARSDSSTKRKGGVSMSARGKALQRRARSVVDVDCVYGASVHPRAGSVVDVASKYGASVHMRAGSVVDVATKYGASVHPRIVSRARSCLCLGVWKLGFWDFLPLQAPRSSETAS